MELDENTVFGVAVAVIVIGLLAILIGPGKKENKVPVLNPNVWQEFPVSKITKVSPNTAIYRLALPKPDDVLGLPIGQHISVQAECNGKNVMRSYTPTSSDKDLGFFELLIKSYPQGNISKYFSTLKEGDRVQIKGPKGQMKYHPSLCNHIGMLAGGTGITPMLQIIRAAMSNPLDTTRISLIYANVSESDILLKDELDQLAKDHPLRFTVYYVLNAPPENWAGGNGFVTKDMIQERLPQHDETHKMLLCGPPPMLTAMKHHLTELGWPKANTISKMPDSVFCF